MHITNIVPKFRDSLVAISNPNLFNVFFLDTNCILLFLPFPQISHQKKQFDNIEDIVPFTAPPRNPSEKLPPVVILDTPPITAAVVPLIATATAETPTTSANV